MPRRAVLVVDDELNYRLFLKTLFEAEGHAVRTAKDGEQGLELALQAPPDLVVLDVMMPRQGGVELYRRLRAEPRLAGVPVIMLSAVGGQTFGHALRMLGVMGPALPEPYAYVQKPARPDDLLALGRAVLGGPATTKEPASATTRTAQAGGEPHGP